MEVNVEQRGAASAMEAAVPVAMEIKRKGKAVLVPTALIDGRTVLAKGRWLRIAAVKDEELVEGEAVRDPESFVAQLKASNLNADIVTFAQKLPDETPKHDYYHEWDNIAVIRVTTYADWWGRLTDPVQRAIKKAKRVGVEVREVDLTDAFVKGIQAIYNETPVRQGRTFWHYQKDCETIRDEHSTYLDRNTFLGAYHGDELVGYIWMVYVGSSAELIQVISKQQHRDKRPTNALIAAAVDICARRGLSHLVYCNYTYNDQNSSLTEFKRRNRFEPVLLPRYYVPLTLKGKIALRLKLHRGMKALLPPIAIRTLLSVRTQLLERVVGPLKMAISRRRSAVA